MMESIENNTKNEKKLIESIKDGSIFIYPTDTIYGIGCNALNEKSVEEIREMKGRDSQKPLSIIAPSKDWIYEHLIADKERVDKYLPGKYTLLLRKKDPSFLSHVSSNPLLGIRIPKHEFVSLIEKAGVPFITTSVNLAGEKPITSLEEIKPEILEQADIIINAGKLAGMPSTIILEDGSELKRK